MTVKGHDAVAHRPLKRWGQWRGREAVPGGALEVQRALPEEHLDFRAVVDGAGIGILIEVERNADHVAR